MTRTEWERVFKRAVTNLRKEAFVPYDTGNLKFNAIKGIWVDENTFRIYIDESVAPYVFFTNEPWINRKGKNPNENWIDKMVDFLVKDIAIQLKGEIKKK